MDINTLYLYRHEIFRFLTQKIKKFKKKFENLNINKIYKFNIKNNTKWGCYFPRVP